MKLEEEENAMDDVNDDTSSRSSMLKKFCYIPVRPKWMLKRVKDFYQKNLRIESMLRCNDMLDNDDDAERFDDVG
ncbi:hypothetical protein GIB67_019653 [Kingdonia uniflora]|uniref:Uncharacterized protein n=1 Tax=Kingdonia uniflora TaxID=39325 RepID=A0A7J7P4A3_9MAGN|nr:hypothetical protein GIB67_019653 [Kingdonia uniflora]